MPRVAKTEHRKRPTSNEKRRNGGAILDGAPLRLCASARLFKEISSRRDAETRRVSAFAKATALSPLLCISAPLRDYQENSSTNVHFLNAKIPLDTHDIVV